MYLKVTFLRRLKENNKAQNSHSCKVDNFNIHIIFLAYNFGLNSINEKFSCEIWIKWICLTKSNSIVNNNNLLILKVCVWIHKGYLVIEKLVNNVGVKSFLYKKVIYWNCPQVCRELENYNLLPNCIFQPSTILILFNKNVNFYISLKNMGFSDFR